MVFLFYKKRLVFLGFLHCGGAHLTETDTIKEFVNFSVTVTFIMCVAVLFAITDTIKEFVNFSVTVTFIMCVAVLFAISRFIYLCFRNQKYNTNSNDNQI